MTTMTSERARWHQSRLLEFVYNKKVVLIQQQQQHKPQMTRALLLLPVTVAVMLD